jgi:hypothetical protein
MAVIEIMQRAGLGGGDAGEQSLVRIRPARQRFILQAADEMRRMEKAAMALDRQFKTIGMADARQALGVVSEADPVAVAVFDARQADHILLAVGENVEQLLLPVPDGDVLAAIALQDQMRKPQVLGGDPVMRGMKGDEDAFGILIMDKNIKLTLFKKFYFFPERY